MGDERREHGQGILLQVCWMPSGRNGDTYNSGGGGPCMHPEMETFCGKKLQELGR